MYEGNERTRSPLNGHDSAYTLRSCPGADNELQGPVLRAGAGQLDDVSQLNAEWGVLTDSSDTIESFAFLPRTSS